MKHWLLHTLYIGALLLLLPACDCGEENIPSTPGDGNMQVVFTLAMDTPQARALARASWGDNNESSDQIGSDLDNHIEADGLKVALYERDGSYIDLVKNLVYYQTDQKNVYRFVGDISLPQTIKEVKVGVFANCDIQTLAGNSLTDLKGSLNFTADATPESIPMWGVKDVTLDLKPGTRQELGIIYLLRAMAKVELGLSDDVAKEGYTLESVSFPAGNYNNSGWCMPAVTDWSVLADTKDLNTENSKNVYPSTNNTTGLSFDISEDKKSSLVYVPEFAKGSGIPIMKILLAKNGGETKEYDVKFATYTDGAAGLFMDVVRNHWYRFNITKVGEDVVSVQLQYEVIDWNEVDNGDLPFN